MRISKDDVYVRMQIPGAVIRQQVKCPHRSFVLRGQITTTDANGTHETVKTNDLFYWPAGHT